MTLYIFDKDKTLLQPGKNKLNMPVTPIRPEEQKLKAGVRKKLNKLRSEENAIALASNQPLVARGQITYDEAAALMEDCAKKVGGVDAWKFCPCDPLAKLYFWVRTPYKHDDEDRKPHPGMIIKIMEELGYSPDDTIMIGDARLDKKAAEKAGVKFIDEKVFFPQGKKQASEKTTWKKAAFLGIGSLALLATTAFVVLRGKKKSPKRLLIFG